MKIWRYLAAIMVFLLCAVPIYGEELSLALIADYDETEKEVWVQVIAKEPISLEAFSFTITYNMDVYELYKGNDLILNGYGYYEPFQKNYQNGGMLVSNALDGKILFSGVHASPGQYQGVIAEVSLLQYRDAPFAEADIGLEIRSLRANGVALPEDTLYITSVEGEKEPSSENDTENTGMVQEPENLPADNSQAENTENIGNADNAGDAKQTESANNAEDAPNTAAANAMSDAEKQIEQPEVAKEAFDDSHKKNQAENPKEKDSKSKTNWNILLYVLAVIVGAAAGVLAYFVGKKRKKK